MNLTQSGSLGFTVLLLACQCLAQSAGPSTTPANSSSPTVSADSAVITPHERARRLYIQTTAAFVEHHDREQAERGYLQVTQFDPGYAPAWFNLGVLAEGDKDWAKAKSEFAEYLRLSPHGPDADRARDQSQLLDKYIQGTIDPVAVKAAAYDAIIQRARALLAANLFREAIAEAGLAQSNDSSRWEAYAVVSLCMAKQHKRDEASKFRDLALAHCSADKREKIRNALDHQILEWNQ